MSIRELVALGTASQVPTRYRNHNGYFLRFDAEGLLFDPGEGTQRQMIFADVSASAITKILITHFHGDHCLGFAGLAQRISLDEVPHPVQVYFPASGEQFYERLRDASLYRARATLEPRPIAAGGLVYEDDTITIEAAKLDHGVDCFGYRLQERDGRRMLPDRLAEAGVRGRAIGELQRRGRIDVRGREVLLDDVSEPRRGQSVAFVMDTRPCEGARVLARDVDLLVCESTYLSSESAEAWRHRHMTALQAAQLASEAGARRLVLTHFSQRYASVEPFVEEARAIHPDVYAVADGDRVPLPPRDDALTPDDR